MFDKYLNRAQQAKVLKSVDFKERFSNYFSVRSKIKSVDITLEQFKFEMYAGDQDIIFKDKVPVTKNEKIQQRRIMEVLSRGEPFLSCYTNFSKEEYASNFKLNYTESQVAFALRLGYTQELIIAAEGLHRIFYAIKEYIMQLKGTKHYHIASPDKISSYNQAILALPPRLEEPYLDQLKMIVELFSVDSKGRHQFAVFNKNLGHHLGFKVTRDKDLFKVTCDEFTFYVK